MGFDGLAQHIYGPRDHYEIDVTMRAKNGGASFGIAAFLLYFAKSNAPSSPSEAAIHTDCSIGQYGLEAAVRYPSCQRQLRAVLAGDGTPLLRKCCDRSNGGKEPKATDVADYMDGCFAEREGS